MKARMSPGIFVGRLLCETDFSAQAADKIFDNIREQENFTGIEREFDATAINEAYSEYGSVQEARDDWGPDVKIVGTWRGGCVIRHEDF